VLVERAKEYFLNLACNDYNETKKHYTTISQADTLLTWSLITENEDITLVEPASH
jgi:hypothetical protein